MKEVKAAYAICNDIPRAFLGGHFDFTGEQ